MRILALHRCLIPRLHDEAGSTSWLYERSTCARRALVELALRALDVRSSCARRAGSTSARRAHVVRSSSHLVEPASSCKRGITFTLPW